MDSFTVSTRGGNFFASRSAHAVLDRDILPAFIPKCRWFAGKARNPQHLSSGTSSGSRGKRRALDRLVNDIATREVEAAKTGTHGHYHQGQVLPQCH